jgi:hypothetical protein
VITPNLLQKRKIKFLHFAEFSSHGASWAPKMLAEFFVLSDKEEYMGWVDILTRSYQL